MGARNSTSAAESLMEAARQGDLARVRTILETDGSLANLRDEAGATPLHYAAMNGHRQMVWLLVERGAEINSRDSQFGATPAGWAIEYLREIGGQLAIEMDDLAYAIRLGDARWASRFLERFPWLRYARDREGTPLQKLAAESGNQKVASLFEAPEDVS